jgi:hypothetical protein
MLRKHPAWRSTWMRYGSEILMKKSKLTEDREMNLGHQRDL